MSDSSAHSDRIFVRGLEFVGYHGVYAHERRDGCRFRLDLEVAVATGRSALTDRLRDTVDYGAICQKIVDIGTGQSVYLVERLAEVICLAVLDCFPVDRVWVTLHKLAPPVTGSPESVGVRITRGRTNG